MVEAEPVLRSLVTCPPQGVRSFAVLPLDSGLGAPAPFDVAIRHAFVPAFHGGLLGDATTAELVGRVLRGEMPVGSAFWLFAGEVVNAGAAAWQVPSLEVSLEPGWATRSDDSCRSVRAEMRGWLDG
jgi:hypothetical protein